MVREEGGGEADMVVVVKDGLAEMVLLLRLMAGLDVQVGVQTVKQGRQMLPCGSVWDCPGCI